MRSFLGIFCLSLLLGTCVRAQTTSYTFFGCVQDDTGEALVGVSILIEGTTMGTVTDLEGCYSLNYSAESVRLVVSYTGFTHLTVEATAGERAVHTLMAAALELEEVVVTGIGIREEKRALGYSSMEYRSPAPAAYDAIYNDVSAGEKTVSIPGKERPEAGQLTAGEVNDFGKWDIWQDISQEDLAEHRAVWKLFPDHRYPVQLTYENGYPAVDIPIRLSTELGEVIWEARTDNHGRAELWRGLVAPKKYEQDRLLITATIGQEEVNLSTAQSIATGINTRKVNRPCSSKTTVDVAMVVDATGSMGDEIAYLSSELEDVIRRSADSLGRADLRFGSVFYRDEGDDYLSRHTNFTTDVESAVSFVQRQSAGGGGDTPEAVDAALSVALDSLSWSEEAAARILFLVLDAPPHATDVQVARMQKLTQQAAQMGVRIIPVVCSGMNKSGEYLLRSMALATNGTYTFLTDHSGIGGKHLEPSTDIYEVELLNDLLVRLIHEFGQTQACDWYPIDPVVAEGEELQDDFTVFPNPTAGPVSLHLPAKKGEVFLVDMRGKIIRRYAVSARRMEINLVALATGTYVLRFSSRKGEIVSQRVIVDRRITR